MNKNLKNLFTEDVQKVLTPDTLTAIEEAFKAKVDLGIEAALLEQDELYAHKLKVLVDTLDKDRANKMMKVVEAVDKNNASKLVNVVKLYERNLKKGASNFKNVLVEQISNYLEEFIANSVDKNDLSIAVKNKTAFNVLENLRKVLAVDSVMMKESVQTAIVDGKDQIEKLQVENKELKTQFKNLYEANQKTEVNMFLEAKTSKLPETKKNFLRKALQDKSLKFIEENFDYTLRLFEKQETSKLKVLKEEALRSRTVKPDVAPIQKVVAEKVNNNDLQNDYLTALSRGKGIK